MAGGSMASAPAVPSPTTLSATLSATSSLLSSPSSSADTSWGSSSGLELAGFISRHGTLASYVLCLEGAKLHVTCALSLPRSTPLTGATATTPSSLAGSCHFHATGTREGLYSVSTRWDDAPTQVGRKNSVLLPPVRVAGPMPAPMSNMSCGMLPDPRSSTSVGYAAAPLNTSTALAAYGCASSGLNLNATMAWLLAASTPCMGLTANTGPRLLALWKEKDAGVSP